MYCREFNQQIDDFLDGRLDRRLIDEFDRHASSCAICSEALKSRERLFDLLENSAQKEWSVDLVSQVMAQIAVQPQPVEESPFRAPLIISVIIGLAVCMFSMFLVFSSILTGSTPYEVIRMIISMVDLPPEIAESLMEALAFLKAFWIGIRTLVGYFLNFLTVLIISKPFITIPIVIVFLLAAALLRVVRTRSKRRLSI